MPFRFRKREAVIIAEMDDDHIRGPGGEIFHLVCAQRGVSRTGDHAAHLFIIQRHRVSNIIVPAHSHTPAALRQDAKIRVQLAGRFDGVMSLCGENHGYAILYAGCPRQPFPGRDAVIVVAHCVDQKPGKTAILSLNIPHAAAPLFGAFDLQAEQCVPAADYGARPVDQHIPGVGAGIVIQMPQIEQAGVTLQFCPLKTAGNAG